MGGDRDHGHVVIYERADLLFQHPAHGAGLLKRSEYIRWDPERVKHFPGPIAFYGVYKLPGGRDGVFGAHLAGKVVFKQVGHEQKRVFCVYEMRGLGVFQHRKKLVKRVELHESQPGVLEDLLLGHDPERFFHHAVGAGIPVRHGGENELAVFADDAEVHAPGVHADSVDMVSRLGGFVYGDLHFFAQPLIFPYVLAVFQHRFVYEAMDLLDLQKLFAVYGKVTEDRAPAGRAEIKTKITTLCHTLPPQIKDIPACYFTTKKEELQA